MIEYNKEPTLQELNGQIANISNNIRKKLSYMNVYDNSESLDYYFESTKSMLRTYYTLIKARNEEIEIIKEKRLIFCEENKQ